MEISFDEMIRQILTEKKISQQDLALQLKVSPSQISRWRYGDTSPRRRKKEQIQKLYDEISVKSTA